MKKYYLHSIGEETGWGFSYKLNVIFIVSGKGQIEPDLSDTKDYAWSSTSY